MSEDVAFLIIWTFFSLVALFCISFRWPGRISFVWRHVLFGVFLLMLIVNAVKAVALIVKATSALSGVR